LQAVTRIVSVLTAVTRAADGATLSEIARDTGLSPATCYRILNALVAADLLGRDSATKRFHIGLGLVRLVASPSPVGLVERSAEAALEALRDRWQECFFVCALVDDEIVCLKSAQTSHPNRMGVTVPVGRRLPAPSASAKAILAARSPAEQKTLLRSTGLQQYTPFTKTSVRVVLADLSSVKTRGYAICDQEMEIGAMALAVPITDSTGLVTRSLGVVGPRERLQAETHEGLLEEMRTSAELLSSSPVRL
jgi:DNA-binding IclR family transcriptional regulator